MSLNVNSDKWGYISDWTKSSSTTGDFFTYPWSRKDWSGLYSNGYQTIDEDIDLSIAPWRINKKSSLVDLSAAYYHNNWKEADSETISDPNERYQMHLNIWSPIINKNVPFILSYWGQTGTTEQPYWSKYWAYKVNNGTKGNNIVGNRYPVANFRYDKIRICPVLWFIATDPDGLSVNMPTRNQFGGLPAWSDIQDKPYCVGVGFEIFIDKNGTWTESQLTVDIDTEFNGCSDSELEDDWFSGYYGYHQMRMPYRYNPAGTHYNNMFFGYSTSNAPDSPLWCHGSAKAFENAFSRSSFTNTSTYGYFPMNGLFSDVDFNEKTSTSSATTFTSTAYIELTADTYEDFKKAVMRELAYIGLPFTISRSLISTASAANNNLYYPVFDSQRCTTGEYKTGEDAEALPNYDWRWIYELDELPEDIEPDPDEHNDDYGNTSNLGSARGLFPAGVNIYLMSRSDYTIFMNELNSYYQGSSPDDWTLDFQGVNPSDYILSAYYTPYNFLKSDTKTAVKIGPLTLTTTAYELSQGSPPDDPNKWKTFSYGTRKVTPLFNDFRDYEPYTTVELYLPLAGTVQLETAYVMNHNITVTYYFDLMSMSGVACVYRDSMLYKTSDFKLGCQVPVLSQNMGDIQNQIMSLDTARKQNNIRLTAATTATTASAIKALSGKASDVSNLAGGAGLLQIASSIVNADKIDYDLTHTPALVSVTGAAEPMNNYSVGQLTPKLIIKRPLMLPDKNDTIYAHTVGNACLINKTVGEMSGLIVCSNTDLTGISATASELQMIQTALTNGIYV